MTIKNISKKKIKSDIVKILMHHEECPRVYSEDQIEDIACDIVKYMTGELRFSHGRWQYFDGGRWCRPLNF